MEIWSSPRLHTAIVLMQIQVLMNMAIHSGALWTVMSFSIAALYEGSVPGGRSDCANCNRYICRLQFICSNSVFYGCCDAHIQLLALLIWWNALWDDFGARAAVGKVLFYCRWDQPLVLKERSPCLLGTVWLGQSMAEHAMLLPCISFSFPPKPLGCMLLPPFPALARQNNYSDVPCGWSRKCIQNVWASNSGNHDQPMESWSEDLCLIWQKIGTLSRSLILFLWPQVAFVSNIIALNFCAVTTVSVGEY